MVIVLGPEDDAAVVGEKQQPLVDDVQLLGDIERTLLSIITDGDENACVEGDDATGAAFCCCCCLLLSSALIICISLRSMSMPSSQLDADCNCFLCSLKQNKNKKNKIRRLWKKYRI